MKFPDKLKELTTRLTGHLISRPPTPQPNHKFDHDEAGCSPTPTPSVTLTTLVGTQAAIKDHKKPVPTTVVEERPISLPPTSTPSKKFVKTNNAQHDIVVLHVAYILRKSTDLQGLILEIMNLTEKPHVRYSSHCGSV